MIWWILEVLAEASVAMKVAMVSKKVPASTPIRTADTNTLTASFIM